MNIIKSSFLGAIAILSLTLFGCGPSAPSTPDAELIAQNKALTAENAQLKIQIKALTPTGASFERDISKPVMSFAELSNFTNTYRSLTPTDELRIPIAVKFDSKDILQLATNNPFVRFYFAINSKVVPNEPANPSNKRMTLVAVGVDPQNADVLAITAPGQENVVSNTLAFEMADTCPPCNHDDPSGVSVAHKNNNFLFPVLTPANTGGYTFKKLTYYTY